MAYENAQEIQQFIEQVQAMTSIIKESMREMNETVNTVIDEINQNFINVNTNLSSLSNGFSIFDNSQKTISTSILTLVSALGAMSAIVTIVTAEIDVFNLSILKNPFVLAAAAIATLVGALTLLAGTENAASVKHRETMEAIQKETDARNDLITKQSEQVDANLSELNNVQSLNNELKGLVDANGRVKKGYEDRAGFIVSVLNKALGEQMKIENGMITGYDKANNSMDNKIAKLKAEAVLEAQLPIYKKALLEATKAQMEADKLESELSDIRMQKKAKEAELEAKYGADWQKIAIQKGDTLITDWGNLENDTKKKEEEFNKQNELTKGYYDDISLYETNAALIASGNAENYAKVQMESAITKAKTVEEKKVALQDEIDAETGQIEHLKELRAAESDEEKQKQMDAQIAAAELKQQNYQAELDQLVEHGQKIAEQKQINNVDDLSDLEAFIALKQEKLMEMYTIDEAHWTEQQKKEAKALRDTISTNLEMYTVFANQKIEKAVNLSTKLGENATAEEKAASAAAMKEAENTLSIMGQNVIDKLDILADLKQRKEAGEKGITDSMIKEAERQSKEATTGYGNVADKINESWDDLPKDSREAFKNVMQPMLEEMQKKEEPLFTQADQIALGILKRLNKSFAIASPSRKVRTIFHRVMEGAEVGLKDKTPALLDQAEELSENVLDAFSKFNKSDIDQIVHNMQTAIEAENIRLRGHVHSSVTQELYAKNKMIVELPSLTGTIHGNIENHIMMDGRETAIQLTPFISEELAFKAR